MTLKIDKPLTWIIKALGLQPPEAPAAFDQDVVLPIVDILQGGWHNALWSLGSWLIPASTVAGSATIINDNPLNTIYVLGMEIDHVGGAADARVDIMLNRPGVGNIFMASTDVPINRRFGHADIFGSLGPLIVPPDFRLAINHPATGVGETLAGKFAFGTMPAGSKVH